MNLFLRADRKHARNAADVDRFLFEQAPASMNLRARRSIPGVVKETLLRALPVVVALMPSLAAHAVDNGRTLSADDVALRVQKFYDQTKDVSASFFQTYFHKLYNRYDRSSGQVVFKKPGKMRWDYAKPNGKIIVSDNKMLRVYEPGDEGAKGQVIEQSVTQAQLPQAMSFLTGAGRLMDDFSFRLLDQKQLGYPKGYVLELRPKKPSPSYDRVLFYVDADPARLGIVHRVLVIDSAGNRNRFDFGSLRFNRNPNDNVFRWNPPAGTRRVKP